MSHNPLYVLVRCPCGRTQTRRVGLNGQIWPTAICSRSSFSCGNRLLFRKVRGIVVNVERRHICNQIVCMPEDRDYATLNSSTLPLFQAGNDDLRKLWMQKSPHSVVVVRAGALLLLLSIVVLVVLEHYCRRLHEESTHCPD